MKENKPSHQIPILLFKDARYAIEANALHEGVDFDSDWSSDDTDLNVPLDHDRIVDYWLGVDCGSGYRTEGYYSSLSEAVFAAWQHAQSMGERGEQQ